METETEVKDSKSVGSGQIKSILKPKPKSSETTLQAAKKKTSSSSLKSVKSNEGKKKVEITTPLHSSTTVKRKSPAPKKDTPLPRVAMLPPKFIPSKDYRKSMTKQAHKTISATHHQHVLKKVEASSKINAKTVIRTTNSSSSTRKKSKSKKSKKKKSKSTSDVNPVVPVSEITPNVNPEEATVENKEPVITKAVAEEYLGKEYLQEISNINALLKSVTDTEKKEGDKAATIQGLVRPFSVQELEQLLTSVGKVATIHQSQHNISLTETAVSSKSRNKKKRKKKKKTRTKEIKESAVEVETEAEPEEKETKEGQGDDPKTSKPKKRKTSKIRSKSLSSVRSDKVKDEPDKTIPARGAAKKNLASKKTLNTSVKLLKSKRKKNKGEDNDDEDNNDLFNELSELDLVKSAILNKKYYEESIALEKMKSLENIPTKKRRSRSQTRKVKTSPNSKTANIVESVQKDLKSKQQLVNQPNQPFKIILGEKPSENSKPVVKLLIPTGPDDVYTDALNNILVNYSHVLRPPQRTDFDSLHLLKTLENSKVTKSKQKLEKSEELNKILSLAKIGFSKQIEVPRAFTAIDNRLKTTSITSLKNKFMGRKEGIANKNATTANQQSGIKTLLVTKARSAPVKPRKSSAAEIFQLSKPHPSKWNDQSIFPSVYQVPQKTKEVESVASQDRWSILNQRTLGKNDEIKQRAEGFQRSAPKDLDDIKRQANNSEERKSFLKNLEKARDAFDKFGIFDTDRRNLWKSGGKNHHNKNANGIDTQIFNTEVAGVNR